MLHVALYQQSMLEVDPDEIRLPEDSFERQLRQVLPRMFTPSEFADFYEADGAGSRCPLQLIGMELLKHRYNVSDVEVVKRCRRDLSWRYAIGLKIGEEPPSTATLSRFRAKLRQRKGADFVFRRSLELAQAEELIPDQALQAIDSTNTDCLGAVIDTFNLITAGIRQVIRKVARCLDTRTDELARQWGLERYLARSIKGAVSIDWSNVSAQSALITEEVRDADRLVQLVEDLKLTWPDDVTSALQLLQQVARQDVEELADGTFRVARGTAPGRVISVTDPEARHGRKSKSKTINGFKMNITGTIESQFVTGIAMTDASTPDAKPTPQLLAQTEALGLKPDRVVGDAAYGTGPNRRRCRELGVDVVSKLGTPRKGAVAKRDFAIDLAAMRVTCPEGNSTTRHCHIKDPNGSDTRVAKFVFDAATCQRCPLRTKCSKATREGQGRVIVLNAYEQELQDLQAFNALPEAPQVLRKRSAVERLISHLVRMGMRQARFFGLHMAQFQGFMTAAAYNLQRAFTLLARRRRWGTT